MELVRLLPKTACPICGNSEYMIMEMDTILYTTDQFGKIIRVEDAMGGASYNGKCMTCGTYFEMVPAYDTFIPMTNLRSKCIDYETNRLIKTNSIEIYNMRFPQYLKSPMSKKGN